MAASISIRNLEMYEKFKLIDAVNKKSIIFEKYYEEIKSLEIVGDVRHKGMLMAVRIRFRGPSYRPVVGRSTIPRCRPITQGHFDRLQAPT